MSEGKFSFHGVVQRVHYEGEGNSILTLEPLNHTFRDLIRVKICEAIQVSPPTPGEVWQISGVYDADLKNGQQIIAEDVFPVMPFGREIIEFLGKNPRFAGISVRTAKKMWLDFGEQLYEIMTNADRNLLCSKVKLNDTLVEILFETWKNYEHVIPVVRFFLRLNLNAKLANKAVKFWGNQTLEKIKDDPYRLLVFCTWEQVDAIACEKFNVASDADKRLISAVEEALYLAHKDNHTAQDYSSLYQRTTRLLGNVAHVDKAFNLALSNGRISVKQKNSVYLYQLFSMGVMETYLSERIARISKGSKNKSSALQDSSVLRCLERYESTLAYSLTEEQRYAIQMVVEQPFVVILGGAGVGKSTVLRGAFHMLPESAVIIQVALTDSAATRMSRSTGRDAISVAKFLSLASVDGVAATSHIFINDASLLDVATYYHILRVLPEGIRLYLVGDPYLLHPVGPGRVLHQLVEDEHPNISELTKVHRQVSHNSLTAVAVAIRNMTPPILERFVSGQSKGIDVSIYPTSDTSTLTDAVLAAYRELCNVGETQILAARDTTCMQMNKTLHLEHKAYLEYNMRTPRSILINGQEVCEGDKIVYKNQSDITRGLLNGSTGVLRRLYTAPVPLSNEFGDAEVAVAEADFDSAGTIQLLESDLDYIELGYAIRLLDTQSSQWERVIIVSDFIEKYEPIIDSTWFYTALTRCEKQAVVVGSLLAFNEVASTTPMSHSRITGLSFTDNANAA